MKNYFLCMLYGLTLISVQAQNDRRSEIEGKAKQRLEHRSWTTLCKHSIHTESEVQYLLNITRDDVANTLYQRDPVFFQHATVLINEDVMALIGYYLIKQNNLKLKNFATLKNLYTPAKNVYFPIFQTHFDDYETPKALLVLPIAETDLRKDLISNKGAAGLWQFMSDTGEEYGIKYDEVDLRANTHASTDAACRYLKSMYKQFSIWPLTVLGYHAGHNNIKNLQNLHLKEFNTWADHWPNFWNELTETTQCHLNRLVALNYVFEVWDQQNILNKSTD